MGASRSLAVGGVDALFRVVAAFRVASWVASRLGAAATAAASADADRLLAAFGGRAEAACLRARRSHDFAHSKRLAEAASARTRASAVDALAFFVARFFAVVVAAAARLIVAVDVRLVAAVNVVVAADRRHVVVAARRHWSDDLAIVLAAARSDARFVAVRVVARFARAAACSDADFVAVFVAIFVATRIDGDAAAAAVAVCDDGDGRIAARRRCGRVDERGGVEGENRDRKCEAHFCSRLRWRRRETRLLTGRADAAAFIRAKGCNFERSRRLHSCELADGRTSGRRPDASQFSGVIFCAESR